MFSAILFAALLAGQAEPRPASLAFLHPPIVTLPVLTAVPGEEDMARAFPRQAFEGGVSGGATIGCVVRATGMLDLCRVIEETPDGQGFGAAALGLAGSFRLRPGTRDGTPADSDEIEIPVIFPFPPLHDPDVSRRDLDEAMRCHVLWSGEAQVTPFDPGIARLRMANEAVMRAAAAKQGVSPPDLARRLGEIRARIDRGELARGGCL